MLVAVTSGPISGREGGGVVLLLVLFLLERLGVVDLDRSKSISSEPSILTPFSWSFFAVDADVKLELRTKRILSGTAGVEAVSSLASDEDFDFLALPSSLFLDSLGFLPRLLFPSFPSFLSFPSLPSFGLGPGFFGTALGISIPSNGFFHFVFPAVAR